MDGSGAGEGVGKCVFKNVGEQFAEDHTAGEGEFDGELGVVGFDLDGGVLATVDGVDEHLDETLDVVAQGELGELFGLVEFFVNEGHGEEAFAEFDEGVGVVGGFFGLKIEEARNNLEVIFDAVVDFAQEGFFFE